MKYHIQNTFVSAIDLNILEMIQTILFLLNTITKNYRLDKIKWNLNNYSDFLLICHKFSFFKPLFKFFNNKLIFFSAFPINVIF